MAFKIIIEGDYACFTRPELKVERVSYDVPTVSALEGIIKSVYWKPALRYVIDRIVVYNPINFTGIRRNEVKVKLSGDTVKKQMNNPNIDISIYTNEVRSQRSTLLLKNVKYGVEFHFEMTGNKSDNEDESSEKHYNILRRRLLNGQTFRTPCLGCSEFPVRKISLVDEFDLTEISPEILSQGECDLGFMLYKMQFKDNSKPINNDWENPIFSDNADAVYYRPKMVNGVIDVAEYAKDLRR